MMRNFILAAATACLIAAFALPVSAQGSSGSSGATAAPSADDTRPARRSRKREGAKKGEMTVKGMAANERRKKCGVEWKEAKAAGKTEGVKWPKFYSQCNARLKGTSA